MAISISKGATHNLCKAISLNFAEMLEKIGEILLFLLCLVLFVVLGPFSAPIALIALCQLGGEENDHISPKPVV
ncbi:MAG: hypothetical protein COA36_16005 [Desulfotalea sp.]|nr:MAG: hypothetical protein COA36_16005 [Desulfotalea sp.]